MTFDTLKKYGFDYSFRALLIFLPFYTIVSVFFSEKLGISGVSFLKEFLLFSMLLTLSLFHISWRERIIWTRYDKVMGLYIAVMLAITVFTTGIKGILYWGRYDFFFLIAFFTIFHGVIFLEKPLSYYIRIFLISWGMMLLLSMLLKWPLSEDYLLYLGYSGNPSNWQFGSSIPIFHGVDGANVRRFQWLLDGPNTMWAYILIYMGILTYYLRTKKDWYFVIGGVLLGLAWLIIYTYSRSALLSLLWALSIMIFFALRFLYEKYRVQMFSMIIIVILIFGWVGIQYAGNMKALMARGWSTNGHMERMTIGIERFISHPFGQWLGSAGPAYRYVQDLSWKKREDIEELDRRYIPESWYIQQLIEWGIFGFLAFMTLMVSLIIGLLRRHLILFGMFISICMMNFFLHTFESSVISLTLFLLIGLILWYSRTPNARK